MIIPDNQRETVFPNSSINSSSKSSQDSGNASWNAAQIACDKQSGYTYQKESYENIFTFFAIYLNYYRTYDYIYNIHATIFQDPALGHLILF